MKKILIVLIMLIGAVAYGQNTFKYEIRANGGLRVGGATNPLIDSITLQAGKLRVMRGNTLQTLDGHLPTNNPTATGTLTTPIIKVGDASSNTITSIDSISHVTDATDINFFDGGDTLNPYIPYVNRVEFDPDSKVPYTGATGALDMGSNNITQTGDLTTDSLKARKGYISGTSYGTGTAVLSLYNTDVLTGGRTLYVRNTATTAEVGTHYGAYIESDGTNSGTNTGLYVTAAGASVSNNAIVATGNVNVTSGSIYVSTVGENVVFGAGDVFLNYEGSNLVGWLGGNVKFWEGASEIFTPDETGDVVAGTGITAAMLASTVYYNGGSAIDISANPQIVAGIDGQQITIIGSSDTNTLTLDDGNGLLLSAQFILGIGDAITLRYVTALSGWVEISRSNN